MNGVAISEMGMPRRKDLGRRGGRNQGVLYTG